MSTNFDLYAGFTVTSIMLAYNVGWQTGNVWTGFTALYGAWLVLFLVLIAKR